MNEWIRIPHDGKLKEHNMIQHTAHNNQILFDIINTFNKRKPKNRFQLENPIKMDVIHVCWQKVYMYNKNDDGIKYKNSQHNK